jgi:hypothetical protein
MAIHIKRSHEGRLHKALGIPQAKKIPVQRLEKAAHSKSLTLRKESQFALNARHFGR